MPIDISFKTDSASSNFTTKTYNDQNYINVEGDVLQGPLNLNGHKITNLAEPRDGQDSSTKAYVDQKIEQMKAMHIQGTMMTVKFDLSRMPYSSVYMLNNLQEQSFFVLSYRLKTRDNLWDARDNPKVDISVKDNYLHIQRKGLFPLGTLTGVGEVLLFKGSEPIDISDVTRVLAES